MPAFRPGASRLDPRLTFETFVVGSCNEVAHAASMAVAQEPGLSHNPLFICGGSAVGKTHLAQAVGERVTSKVGADRVLYSSGEPFFMELVRALRARTISDFRDRLSDEIDLLILDNAHYLVGRDRTREELVHVLESLSSRGKQIVLISSQPSGDMGYLLPRIHSRFEGLQLVEVSPPDTATKLAIVDTRAAAIHLDLPADIRRCLAQRARNVRELEGMLNRLSALQTYFGRDIDMSIFEEHMREPASLPGHEAASSGESDVTSDGARLPPNLRVLFLDDHTALVDMVLELLRNEGACPVGFTDPRLAIEAFEADPDAFDLVATDLVMPDMSGDEVIARVRALRPGMPVLLQAGYVPPGVLEDIVWLPQPFTVIQLVDAVCRALKAAPPA